VFDVRDLNLDDVGYKSNYNSRLAKVAEFIGNTFWMLRMMVNKEGTGLTTYNESFESMIVQDELPNYPLEYKKNKLIVTGEPSQMYHIDDWCIVKCIHDSNTANVKNFAFPMP
jgi:hypothetical protein